MGKIAKWSVPSVVFLALAAVGVEYAATGSYTQTNLVSDLAGTAISTDSHLVNPWGLSHYVSASAKEGEWWASDQQTGVSTLYDANGMVAPLVVTIPPGSGSGVGSPTGTVGFGTNFVFVTLDGTISQWLSTPTAGAGKFNGATFNHATATSTCASCHTTSANIMVNNSSKGRVYTGATAAKYNGSQTLYVVGPAGVEAYDTNFNPVTLPSGAFTDADVPAGFTPYGIQSAGAKVYVTYSPAAPASGGYVDAYTPAGALSLTLQQGTWFDEPWGIALAPSGFGAFSNALLVGNTGNGTIAAFSPTTGKFAGLLKNSAGKPIVNSGLWAIYFGDGNADTGPTTTLYFNAGIDNFTHGLFGAITAN